jgi:glycine cleavage system H protein
VNVPDDRRYTEQHEWALVEDGKVRVGITDYAQEALGEVVNLYLPQVGRRVRAGDVVAEVESHKSVGEVYAPVSGVVLGVNDGLHGHWELVNDDPYGEGWLILMEADDPTLLDALLDPAAYRLLLG